MAQTSVLINQEKAINGMLADAGKHYVISRNCAGEVIPYGRAVLNAIGLENNCRLPKNDTLVITDSAGTYTSGSLVSVITLSVSGVKTVTTIYHTDKDTTMADHAANILAALGDAYSCAYSSGSHTITLVMKSEDIISSATTGMVGTMTIVSETVSCSDVAADVIGIAVMDHNREQQLVTGLTQYAVNEPVNVLRQGAVYVYAEEAVNPDSTVYVRMVTNGAKVRGMIGASSDSGKCLALPGVVFADKITAAGVVKLEINLP